jgi:hypothetical protein
VIHRADGRIDELGFSQGHRTRATERRRTVAAYAAVVTVFSAIWRWTWEREHRNVH